MWMREFGKALALVAAASIFVASEACAEMIVLASNVPGIDEGARLPDDAMPELPPGGFVRVLLVPSNKSKVFEGPPLRERGEVGGVGGVRGFKWK